MASAVGPAASSNQSYLISFIGSRVPYSCPLLSTARAMTESKASRTSGYLATTALITAMLSWKAMPEFLAFAILVTDAQIQLVVHRHRRQFGNLEHLAIGRQAHGRACAGQIAGPRALHLGGNLVELGRAHEIHRRRQVPRRQIVKPGIVHIAFSLEVARLGEVPVAIMAADGIQPG